MKNWNTDTSKFTTAGEKRIWELIQLLDYGADAVKLNQDELRQNWDEIRYQIQPETRRLWEFILWGKRYSLPTSDNFWTVPPQPIK